MKTKDAKKSSKFVKVICPKCNNEQVIFGKASTEVRCSSCGKVLVGLTGGKSKIKAKIVEILG